MTWRKREIMDEIHSCSPFCTQPICVAVRDAVQAEREACAKVCDDSVEYAGSELARQIRARNQTTCVHEWVDDTKTKPAWRCAKCGVEYKKEQA